MWHKAIEAILFVTLAALIVIAVKQMLRPPKFTGSLRTTVVLIAGYLLIIAWIPRVQIHGYSLVVAAVVLLSAVAMDKWGMGRPRKVKPENYRITS
jgi:hypothetical protein